MPFRDFFILLGVLAATALITVVVVETAINRSVETSDPTTSVSIVGDANNENEPSPSEPLQVDISAPENHAKADVSSFPGEVTSVRRYRVMVESASILVRGQSYSGETGHIEVQEVRGAADSNTLQIPVVRLFSQGNSPSLNPVFLLADGPGQSNIWNDEIPVWLLNRHDIVMVGYRGVDGSVSLELPEAQQALFDIRNAPLSTGAINTLNQAVGRGLQRLTAAGVRLDHYTASDVVDDINEIREAFEYASIQFFAVGYGAQLAMLYGQQYPDYVTRNIVFAPPFTLSDTNDVLLLSRQNFGDLLIKLASIQDQVKNLGNETQSTQLISQVLASLNTGSSIARIEDVNTSSLVLIGQLDSTTTRDGINQFMSQLPNGTLVELGNVARTLNDDAYFSTMFRSLTSTFFNTGNVIAR